MSDMPLDGLDMSGTVLSQHNGFVIKLGGDTCIVAADLGRGIHLTTQPGLHPITPSEARMLARTLVAWADIKEQP